MATRRILVSAATSDAISNEEIRRVDVPSTVNMWAVGATAGDEIGLLLNRTEIMPSGRANVETTAGLIDTDRDQLVFNTVVGRGQLRVPVPTVTTSVEFLLSVEPIL